MIRKEVQGVVYRIKNKRKEFLLMLRKKHWIGYEFVKGGIEKNETPEKAIIRELEEEAGVSKSNILSLLPTFIKMRVDYPSNFISKNYSGAVFKTFIVKIKSRSKIRIDSGEHNGYCWVSDKDVLKVVWRKNLKRVFTECLKQLKYF